MSILNFGSYVPQNGSFQPSRNETNNLTITSDLYSIRYRSDGMGRDSYVYHNNGGLMNYSPSAHKKSDLISSGRLIPNRPDRKGVGDPSRPVHYVCNGSGRDSYVFANDGGLTNPNKPCDPRIVFKQNLRTYHALDDYL